jgi:predicted nucleotidyltransferase
VFSQYLYHEGGYDICIYSIAKYFRLLKDGNPNIIESLFTNEEDVIWQTPIGRAVRYNRSIFLSSKLSYKFFQYSRSCLKKFKDSAKMKDAVSSLRIMDELCQLSTSGSIDMKRNSLQYGDIRKYGVSFEYLFKLLEDIKSNTPKDSYLNIPMQEEAIRNLLINCVSIEYDRIYHEGNI